MPAILEDDDATTTPFDKPTTLPFPPITREHILHCSYHYWHHKYRGITPKARLIPLNQPFLEYLRADGIVLPSDDDPPLQWSDADSGFLSASDNPDAQDDWDDEGEDVASSWRQIHSAMKDSIAELGGKVLPKLNWSAPKDATWINANTMVCQRPSEVCMLLKSSDFVAHDLTHAYDGTVETPGSSLTEDNIPYHLVLRKAVEAWHPSVEFRCFVRGRRLLCISQRDMNHYDFLATMSGKLRSLIQEFFDVRLRDTFDDENFVFDIYVPTNHNRVWLVDINPWAPRTDPLLYSWMEILDMPEPPEPESVDDTPEFVRLPIFNITDNRIAELLARARVENAEEDNNHDEDADEGSSETEEEDADEEIWLPELRLVRKGDPEASMNSPQYSAHKLPKDIVEASQSGEGLREFAKDWKVFLDRQQQAAEKGGESSDGD